MKFEYSFIAVTASDGDCYLSNFRPRQCGLFIVILSSTLSLKTVVFFYLLFVLRLLSPRLKYSRLALCINALPYAPYFRQRFAPFFRHWRRSQGYLQVPSYSLLQFVITVTASDGDCYLSNFRPRQCGLFIVILSSTLSLKTVVFFYLLFVLRLLSPRLKYSRLALCINALPYAPYFRQRFAPFFRHWRRSQGYLQVPSYSLLQFVITVTASDGDCYLSNFRPRQCGLFIVILSSTLSLKTVHRTVFLTVAFKSRHRLLA